MTIGPQTHGPAYRRNHRPLFLAPQGIAPIGFALVSAVGLGALTTAAILMGLGR